MLLIAAENDLSAIADASRLMGNSAARCCRKRQLRRDGNERGLHPLNRPVFNHERSLAFVGRKTMRVDRHPPVTPAFSTLYLHADRLGLCIEFDGLVTHFAPPTGLLISAKW
jgi:hypothetical protein